MQLSKLKWVILSVVYFLIAFAFYQNTIHSKFIFDWNSWMVHYINEGWAGWANCFGDTSMRWGYHLINLLLWKIFGLNDYGWFCFFLALHVVDAILLVGLVYKLLFNTAPRHSFAVAASSGLLWLVSPYHSETVVWGATILFLAMTFQVLVGMLLFLRYTETKKIVFLIGIFVCYFCAMFTFEAFLPFPALLFVLWLTTRHTRINNLKVVPLLLRIMLPMVLGIALYFLGNQFRIGSWVGHYGEASHLNTDINLIVPNISKYLLKLMYVPLYFSFKQRDAVYAFLESRWLVNVALCIFVLALLLMTYKFFFGERRWKLSIGLMGLFLLALVPVINLYFMYYKDIEQDRYVYFASAFFYPALIVSLHLLFKRWLVVPLIFFFFVSANFLQRNNYCWQQSGKISRSLMNDFKWQEAKRVFVLLTPDNFNGAYCMRSMPNSTLEEMLYVQRGIEMTDRIHEVYQYNLTTPEDVVLGGIIDSTTLQVRVMAEGSWLWRNSFGASNFETDNFKAELNEWYPWFNVTFKNKQPGDVFIYAENDHWKVVENF